MSKLLKMLFLSCIWFYRKLISPLVPPRCRYLPTCSQYAIDAINELGPYKGFLMAIKRIGRCHPWGGHGFDPVSKEKKRQR